jgi:hypothetical protein
MEILINSINFYNREININEEGKSHKKACTMLLLLMIKDLVTLLRKEK